MPSINDLFTATVRDISSDGNGIVGHPCGQVFFVPGVWIGEVAEFRITGFKKRFGFAEMVNLLEPSSFRIDAKCPHHGFGAGDCGGCPWQFVDYKAQLEVKEKRVRDTLARLNIDECIRPILGSTKQFGYRNRAQLKSDGMKIGFLARSSKALVPIEDCPILTDHNRDTLKNLLASLPNQLFKPIRKSPWNSLDIDEQVTAENVAVNQRRPFRQANTEQNERMRAWLLDSVSDLDKNGDVLELFAGSGNFTEVLAKAGFKQILAVEVVADAIQQLQQRFAVNTLEADLFSEQGVTKVAKAMAKAQLLVLNPPRDGFSSLHALLNICTRIEEVRYISCNLATFSRDLQVLLNQGFRAEVIQPIDQFPHTPHVELLTRFCRP